MLYNLDMKKRIKNLSNLFLLSNILLMNGCRKMVPGYLIKSVDIIMYISFTIAVLCASIAIFSSDSARRSISLLIGAVALIVALMLLFEFKQF